MFSHILNLDRINVLYEGIDDKRKLLKQLDDKLGAYNSASKHKMDLAFFDQAIKHILRISRALYQPRGNLLLIGVGGSGKQSLTRLSTFILNYICYQIELTKNYNLDSLREDIKKMMLQCGVEGKQLVFLLTDTQILHESFLEDINSLLNSGEITNLFTDLEIDGLIDGLRPEIVERMKLPDSKDIIFENFVSRVRDKLHIVMCMSPVGDTLRIRCRMFPSLVNCCTLDWFDKWPEDALLSVSQSFISNLLINSGLKQSLSQMCVTIHLSAETAADNFYNELRRKMYLTPKSYLDMLNLYDALYQKKKVEHNKIYNKLSNGLDKLKETRDVVNVLQEKLTKMIPDLEIQKKKTEEYYVQVQIETEAAQIIQNNVEKETEFIEIQAQDCQIKAGEAEKDLADAMPGLKEAMVEVQALAENKKDIVEFKSYTSPPPAVKMVMEAVCVLLNSKTD